GIVEEEKRDKDALRGTIKANFESHFGTATSGNAWPKNQTFKLPNLLIREKPAIRRYGETGRFNLSILRAAIAGIDQVGGTSRDDRYGTGRPRPARERLADRRVFFIRLRYPQEHTLSQIGRGVAAARVRLKHPLS